MSTSISAAEIVGSVDDLLLHIFSCLPSKSFIRFKLVSKHWNTLITGHHVSFLRNQSRVPVGLICPDLEKSTFDYIPLDVTNPTGPPFRGELRFQDNPWRYWIQHSCNGLLLCCSSGDEKVSRDYYCKIGMHHWCPIRSCCVYNPTTKRFTEIPRPDEYPKIMLGVNLAFDPAKSPDYKVVCVTVFESFLRIEMYSSESGAWAVSSCEPFASLARFDHGVYWNDSIHWIDYWFKEMLYFSVDEEKLRKLQLPDTMVRDCKNPAEILVGYIGESCDHLHIVETTLTEFNVYEMKRDYSEWFVRYRVDVTILNVLSNLTSGVWTCIFSLVRVEGEGSFLVFQARGKILRYYLDRNTFEEFPSVGNIYMADYRLPRSFEHIESIAGV